MKIEDRPTEMLERQFLALRNASRNRRHSCHTALFRKYYIRGILEIRNELRNRGIRPK